MKEVNGWLDTKFSGFRIQKRRDKTANEFGESLMVYLGKKSDKAVIEYKKFKEALEKFTLSV